MLIITNTAFGENYFEVKVHRYPFYDKHDGWRDPPATSSEAMPSVPFLYDPVCPPGSTLQYRLIGDQIVKPNFEQIWCYTDPEKRFTIGTNCYCDQGGNRVEGQAALFLPQRKWYVWLTVHPGGLIQPLRFVYGAEPGVVVVPDDDSLQPRFEWGYGSSFAKFFEIPEVVQHLDIARVQPGFWRQFVAVCPKTFNDVLRAEYGLEVPAPASPAEIAACPEPLPIYSDRPVVDVKPGMRLRLENALFQDLVRRQEIGEDNALLGYGSPGTQYLNVHMQRGAKTFLSFDTFWGHLRERSKTPLTDGDPMLAANAVDLTGSPQTYRYPRIFLPEAPLPSNPTTAANAQVVLIGANTRARLNGELGGKVTISSTSIGSNTNPGSPQQDPNYRIFTFRGRSVLVPEIMVSCIGQREWISVGTHVRQLAERELDLNEPRSVERIVVRRLWKGRHVPVRFHVDPDHLVYELPLIKGDQVQW